MNNQLLLDNLRCIPDWPIKGVNFRDVTTLFKSAACVKTISDEMYELYKDKGRIKIFPDKPVTAKPAETRMGSGKGAPEYWVSVVKPGRVMFEIAGVPEETAREALRLASHKLPIKCKIIAKGTETENGGEEDEG